jgi:hypothetical protein
MGLETAALIALIAGSGLSAANSFRGKGGDTGSSDSEGANAFLNSPEMKEMLGMGVTQQRRSDPLHAALTQLGMNILPNMSTGPLPGRTDTTAAGLVPSGTSVNPNTITPHEIPPWAQKHEPSGNY